MKPNNFLLIINTILAIIFSKVLDMENNSKSVTVVGAGLVGTLTACFFAKRGFHVTIYEKREDIRVASKSRGKSINLALSTRGLKALRFLNLEKEILKNAIPMKGRCLHLTSGNTKCVAYDPVSKRCIYSINRNNLNGILLNLAETFNNVQLNFSHKLLSVDFDNNICKLKNLKTNLEIINKSDLIIGADGAYSTVRKFVQETSFFSFQQKYIDHGYVELNIEPKFGKNMIPNHLHIWPRKTFMLIALPNQDHSWTVTLFMPFDEFKSIDSRDKLLKFFNNTFSDVIPFIGIDNLVTDFFKYKPNSLITIKCDKFYYKNCLLIGDAAHAIVPFYGQGMNAGFEDCTILNEILDLKNDNLPLAIEEFSVKRRDDVHAISDLALYNYIEMRDLVTDPFYTLRKFLDTILLKFFKELWIPLYISVTFTSMSYSDCILNRKQQDFILKLFFSLFAIIMVMYLIFLTKS